MSIFYVRSTDGSDADNGTTWALAKATLAGAYAVAAAGDTIYVSQVHAETQASAITLTSPGTTTAPCRVVCANDGAEPPTAVAATATISTTGANAINFAGFAYYYGIIFQAGSSNSNGSIQLGAASGTAFWLRFETCTLKLNNTSASPRITMGFSASAASIETGWEMLNCILQFGNAAQNVVLFGPLTWEGGSVAGTAPTTLLTSGGNGNLGRVHCRGLDLSLLGSGTTLVSATSTRRQFHLEDCKLGASVGVSTGTIGGIAGCEVRMVNCDSGNTNYRYHKENYRGIITSDVTVYRTAGATDGTTHFSRKFVSSANTNFFIPLVSDWVYFWNDTTGSVTAAVEVVTDNITLTDAEAWVEVEALTNSGFPFGSVQSDRASDIVATPAAQTTSVLAWTGAPGTPVMQVLSKAVTTAVKGVVRARVCLAKATTTMYADQLILSGSGRQYMTGAEGVVNEAATGGTTVTSPFILGG